MPASHPGAIPQQGQMDDGSFGAEQEISFARLQKYNQSTDNLATEGHSIFERRRNDSLHSRKGSVNNEIVTSFGNHPHGLPSPSVYNGSSQTLNINPSTVNIEPSHGDDSSQIFSADTLWMNGQAPTLSLASGDVMNATAGPLAAHATHVVSRFGQYTPPEDGPPKGYNAEGEYGVKPGLYPMGMPAVMEENNGFGRNPSNFLHDQEPGYVPESPPTQPKKRRRKGSKTDSPEDEMKREEFLARNRVAASKSRQKKKEWTQSLEEQLKNLQAEHTHLSFTVNCLRDEIIAMKTFCLNHVDCNCSKIREYMNRSIELLGVQNGHQLSMIASPVASLQAVPNSDNGSDGVERQCSEPAKEDASVGTVSSVKEGLSETANHPADRSSSLDNTVSTPHPSYESSRISLSGSPSGTCDSSESPKPEAALADELVEEGDADLETIWAESVGNDEYITGV